MGILAPQPGIEPIPHALEGKLLSTGPHESSVVNPLHCSFDLHFSKLVMLSIFSCACLLFVRLLWRNVYLDLGPIF